MNTLPDSRKILWQEIVRKIESEWEVLVDSERLFVSEKIECLTALQQELHALVAAADGEDVCRDCSGGCCGDGLYHPTLVTILAHLVSALPLPTPDFRQSCPYLGVTGCHFLPAVRPFNCLIFVCEKIEERSLEEDRMLIAELEAKIRAIYEGFDRRYVGSSLRGLMNRGTQTDLQDFLKPR